MNRIYVASSWRNKIQQDVVAALREVGHEVYDFKNPSPDNHGFHWSEVDPEWKVWTPERYRNLLDHPVAKKGFKSDWEAMLWADTCVLVLPSVRSAHIEAGYFVGAHKRLVILLDAEGFEPELMYKMAGRICCSIPEVTETLNLKQMNEPNPTTTAMADAAIWIERAEKAEAELGRVKALLSETEKQFGHQWEAASDKLMALIDTHKDLQAEAAEMREALNRLYTSWGEGMERDHYKNKVERCREILGAQANESICEAAERVQAAAAEMQEALENALVICQCFADGQEASPGFMDNNENVIRIKDALAKVKALPA